MMTLANMFSSYVNKRYFFSTPVNLSTNRYRPNAAVSLCLHILCLDLLQVGSSAFKSNFSLQGQKRALDLSAVMYTLKSLLVKEITYIGDQTVVKPGSKVKITDIYDTTL